MTVGDVVIEAAGVSMRERISEGMWKLTMGLMEVAPRPLEIVVARVVEKETEDDGVESESGEENVNGSYLQLEMGKDDDNITSDDDVQDKQTTTASPSKEYSLQSDSVLMNAKLHHLPDNNSNNSTNQTQQQTKPSSNEEEAIISSNPFNDPHRFGPERKIIFHTESLGIKLHRSPTEGLVHIIHVAPYRSIHSNNDDAQKQLNTHQEGEVEAGDVIMEVGGVSIRNVIIGKIEWADMVHFIKYVGRPLDMVVAKDLLFTRERAGVVTDIVVVGSDGGGCNDVVENQFDLLGVESVEVVATGDGGDGEGSVVLEEEPQVEETEMDGVAVVVEEATPMEGKEKMEDSTNEAEVEPKEDEPMEEKEPDLSLFADSKEDVPPTITTELCFAFATDGICGTLAQEKEETNELMVDAPKSTTPTTKKLSDNSWIKSTSASDDEAAAVVDTTMEERKQQLLQQLQPQDDVSLKQPKSSPSSFFSRTHPTEKSSVIHISPLTKPSATHNVVVEAPSSGKSVSELKSLFSPIKNPEAASPSFQSAAVDSPNAEIEEVTPDEIEEVTTEALIEEVQAADDEEKQTVSPISEKRIELAKTLIKEKREHGAAKEETTRSEAPGTPASKSTTEDGERDFSAELGPTPEKPFDETADSSFHATVVDDLASEFSSSPSKVSSVPQSESRDDKEHKSVDLSSIKICAKPEKKKLVATWSQELGDKRPPEKSFSVPPPPLPMFGKNGFVMDEPDSPFVGNIKFGTPKQKHPESFSQAFVVQKMDEGVDTSNIRWEVESPLFTVRKNGDVSDNPNVGSSPYLQIETPERTQPERLFPDPLVKGFDRTAFDFSQLDLNEDLSMDSEGGSLSDTSFNLNETIVYADEMEAQAQNDCCTFDTFCADTMFEGLVSNCGNVEAQRRTKEKVNKVPSPRRKNLLSRLRKGKKKKSKQSVEYGNLNDEEKETMKGIRKAHVQLAYQKFAGYSKAAATQYGQVNDELGDLIEI